MIRIELFNEGRGSKGAQGGMLEQAFEDKCREDRVSTKSDKLGLTHFS